MASATATVSEGAKVRLVRCPKCLKLLPERADVPMYKCGCCGAILRAKNRYSSKQDVSSAPEAQSPSRKDSLNSSDSANCHLEKGESSNAAEESVNNYADNSFDEVEDEKSSKVGEQVSDGSCLPQSISQSVKSEERLDTEHLATQSNKNLIFSTASSLDAEALSQNAAASEEETIDRPLRAMQNNHPRYSTASSSDDGSQTPAREKYRQMSRRTYRDQRFSSSIGTSSNQGEGLSRSSTANADVQRGMSTKSDAFYSVNRWLEPEDGPSRSLSGRSAFSGDSPTKYKKLELLKLVEELRDQLTEKKQRSQETYRTPYQCPRPCRPSQMPSSYLHCHLEPNLCCNNALCTACSYNFCCRALKARRFAQHENPSYPYSRPKARTTKSYCRPISGGAPFVTCNNCFEVLHMPADFLISTKTQLNKLQCGACSKIMVLSFPARHPKPSRTPHAPVEPPEDPISFSEDYGISFADSSSMEAEPVLHVSKASSQASDSEKASLHRLMGYPSARDLLF